MTNRTFVVVAVTITGALAAIGMLSGPGDSPGLRRAAYTTDTPAPATTSAAPVEVTTTSSAPAPSPATARPVQIADAAVTTTTTAPLAVPGHYSCTGATNETAVCGRDEDQPERPASLTGDQPGQTLGSTDAAYGADLTAQLCAVKPWLCGN